MSAGLEGRLRAALGGSALVERLPLVVDPFVLRRGDDAAAAALEGPRLVGLARALAGHVEAARYLAHRPLLLERIAGAGPDALRARGAELAAAAAALPADLEGALDALRLLRRDETLFAAALELGGLAPFDEASRFLSQLAEAILEASLTLARRDLPAPEASLAVLGMGKIGGREFTHHSDLDLIFLCRGGVEAVALASRVAQRLIAYLTTRTGAGVAYAVDSRLRPSGSQGVLVTTLDSFARYQREEAQTWEHLALMRARVVAGDLEGAVPALDEVRRAIVGRRLVPWAEVASMRRKIEEQRGSESGGRIAFKTGRGGLMDVDFLAAGAALERGADVAWPAFPGNGALLRRLAPAAPAAEPVLGAYGFLRRVEACLRWVSGRAVETLEPAAQSFAWVAALAQPDAPAPALLERVGDARRTIRSAFEAVVEARSIAGIAGAGTW